MGTLSIWHWLIVLAIVVLVFGTKRLRSLGGDLGATIKGFRQSMNEGGAAEAAGEQAPEAGVKDALSSAVYKAEAPRKARFPTSYG